MVVSFKLVDHVAHRLGPETVDIGYFLNFINEVIVGGGVIDLRAKGDGDEVRDCDESSPHARVVPAGVLHGICLKGNFGPEFCGDFDVLADRVAGADVVLVNFEEGGGAALVEHVADDGG